MRLIFLISLLLTSSIVFGQKQTLLHVVGEIFRDSLSYTTMMDTVIISKIRGSNQNVIVREKASIKPATRPLILINGIVIEDESILGQVEMREVKKIDVLSDKTKSSTLYGVRGIHGVVLITVGSRVEKKIRRMNDGS